MALFRAYPKPPVELVVGDFFNENERPEKDFSENNNEQYVFTASDGVELMYNLYLPGNYEAGESYPMIIFMLDATGEGDDKYKTLTESLGAVIWTTDESQLNNECIVLAPQYVDNNGDDLTYTMELINAVSENYKVDTSRLYLAGQSWRMALRLRQQRNT